jgi:hypothetical protein
MDAYKGRHAFILLYFCAFSWQKVPWLCWSPFLSCNSLKNLEIFRSQTTKGIWLAQSQNIEPCTLVMDLEGTDGRERGEVMKMKLP